MTKVEIPTALRTFAGNKDTVELEGATVGELLGALGAAYPQLKKHLFDEQGKLRNFVNVYVNDDDIKHLDKENTPVSAKDVISIIPSVAGGAAASGSAGGAAVAVTGRTAPSPSSRSSDTAGTSSCRRWPWRASRSCATHGCS